MNVNVQLIPEHLKCVKLNYVLKTNFIDDPTQLEGLDLTPKPGNCPNYWPAGGGGAKTYIGPDALCGGIEKCYEAAG
ncbi:unnamed protein product, partial [Didymodactylos carnosus]